MNDHERCRELLALGLYDEVSATERHELASHLTTCAACRAFESELDRGLGALARTRADASDALPDDWEQRLRAATSRAPAPRGRAALLATFAAGLAAGLTLTLALQRAREEPSASGRDAAVAEAHPAFARDAPPPPAAARGALGRLAELARG